MRILPIRALGSATTGGNAVLPRTTRQRGVRAEAALASLGFASWQGLSDWLITADEATADTVCDTLAFLLHGE